MPNEQGGEGQAGGSGRNARIELTFIINGEDVGVEVNPHEPLKAARDRALSESKNTGRPFDEWEVRTEAGALLEPAISIANLGLKTGARLLLSLKVGAGGA